VTLRGDHDAGRKQALRDALDGTGPQLNVIVDLTECTFVDSSVVAALRLPAMSQARAARSLVIPPKSASLQRAACGAVWLTPPAAHVARRGDRQRPHNEHVIHIRDRGCASATCGPPNAPGWTGESTGRMAERGARASDTARRPGAPF
jgi:hypothetical protein